MDRLNRFHRLNRLYLLVLFGSKGKNSATTTDAQITVSGGYSPSTITVPVGIQTKLTFTRTDTNSCLEELIIPDLKIKKISLSTLRLQLPLLLLPQANIHSIAE